MTDLPHQQGLYGQGNVGPATVGQRLLLDVSAPEAPRSPSDATDAAIARQFDPEATPMLPMLARSTAMEQYRRFKAKHADVILLFELGDFYEAFHDDARTIGKALGLTVTRSTAGTDMAGVPYATLEKYLSRLIAQGFKVAVCQITDWHRIEPV